MIDYPWRVRGIRTIWSSDILKSWKVIIIPTASYRAMQLYVALVICVFLQVFCMGMFYNFNSKFFLDMRLMNFFICQNEKKCKTWNKAYLVVSSATMLSKFSPSAKQATIQGKNDLESASKNEIRKSVHSNGFLIVWIGINSQVPNGVSNAIFTFWAQIKIGITASCDDFCINFPTRNQDNEC